jgi:predicted secreted protein
MKNIKHVSAQKIVCISSKGILLMSVFCMVFLLKHHNFSFAMSSYKNMNEEKIIIIKKEDNNRELTMQKGDIVQIELEGTGSTGYWWHLIVPDSEPDSKYIQLVSEETKALTEGKPGAPILGIWRFQALKKGTADIRMAYYRTWEGRERALEHFLIRVTIKD